MRLFGLQCESYLSLPCPHSKVYYKRHNLRSIKVFVAKIMEYHERKVKCTTCSEMILLATMRRLVVTPTIFSCACLWLSGVFAQSLYHFSVKGSERCVHRVFSSMKCNLGLLKKFVTVNPVSISSTSSLPLPLQLVPNKLVHLFIYHRSNVSSLHLYTT